VAAHADWNNTAAGGFKKQTFAELGFTPPDGKSFNDRVSSWLGPGLAPDGQSYNAFTDFGSGSWLAYIGGNYNSATPGQQAIIAVHESLHMATNLGDADLANALGINLAGGADPSEAISFFLAAGCPGGYTYPPKK
jgi:hypothetical protein